MSRKGCDSMEVIIKKPDLLSRLAVLYSIPIALLRECNLHISNNELSVGDMVHIPGYWTREERLSSLDITHPVERERIQVANSMESMEENPKQSVRLPVKIQHSIVDQTCPYSSSKCMNDMEILTTIYPFLQMKSIGKSELGQDIWELRIGIGPKKVHMNASMHANEWITSLVLMKWLNDYLLALTTGTNLGECSALELFLECDLSLVMMVNPDGVDLVVNGPSEKMKKDLIRMNDGREEFLGWKANIRGIDLNNQFPANWEIEKKRKRPKKPAARDFPGIEPLTESEVKSLVALVQKEGFDRVVSLHTQGEEFYWGYEKKEPEITSVMAMEFTARSGYKAVRYIDSHAGFKDWFIDQFKKPGFTLELGKGINPLPLSQFEQIYRDTKPILNACLYL